MNYFKYILNSLNYPEYTRIEETCPLSS